MSLQQSTASHCAICRSEKSCFDYLISCKWRMGFKCRRCAHSEFGKGKKWHHRRCKKCRYDESATANTLFHKLKFPIKKAFEITFELMRNESGLSTCEISRRFGIQQSTAWFFKRKIQQGAYGIERGYFYLASNGRVKSKDYRTINFAMLQATLPEFSTQLQLVVRHNKISGECTVHYAKISLKKRDELELNQDSSMLKELHRKAISTVWTNNLSFVSTKKPSFASHYRKELISWLIKTHKRISRKHLFYYCCEFICRYRNLINHLKAWEMLLDVLVLHPKLAYKKLRSV